MTAEAALPRVVILGAGFGGLKCARALGSEPVRITVIDRSNHHLFQPLLYQVATATLSPADIASPIRSVLRNQKNTECLMAEVAGIDTAKKQVTLADGHLPAVPYDFLVIATGARHGYFGHDEWEKFAPGLKSITDATFIRQRILQAFEQAEMEPDPGRREELLHFILVGGGPTGVEMAGAIAELASIALVRDFRRVNPRSAKITLVEAGPRLLAPFSEASSLRAKEDLEALGVTVMTNSRVERISPEGAWVNGQLLRSATVIWTAGVVASPAATWLKAPADRAGRVLVDGDCSVPGAPGVFAIGDTAAFTDSGSGKPLPGVAPVAMQQGIYVAQAIARKVRGAPPPPPFRYRDKGNLATIGRSKAVAEIGSARLAGLVAWVAWLVVHIFYLIGFRNRVLVILEWAWAYLFFQRGARLIVPPKNTPNSLSPP